MDTQFYTIPSGAPAAVKDTLYGSIPPPFDDTNSKRTRFLVSDKGSLVSGLVSVLEGHVTVEITTLSARDGQPTPVNRESNCRKNPPV